MSMFTAVNPKLVKGEELGFRSFGIHFAPSDISGYQVCASASAGCTKVCLYTSGHGKFTRTQEARIKKTRWFFEDRPGFMKTLDKNIQAAMRNADRAKLAPAFRLNLTSDVRWENVPVLGMFPSASRNIMEAYPDVQFYDYTKHTNRRDIPSNYHLTFSRSETNDKDVDLMFSRGYNVAVVFNVKKGDPLPAFYKGRPVIDGDLHDLRFLDPQGVWVGLRGKGEAKKDDGYGFVLTPTQDLFQLSRGG